MGFDFISKTKKSVRKSLSAGHQKYSNPTLLQKQIKGRRTIKITPLGSFQFSAGDLYEVSWDGSRIVVCAQMRPVGISDNPPPSVLQKLQDEGGTTVGLLYEIGPDNDYVNIALFEGEDEEKQ
jgi:hypothetical protein